MSTEAKTSDRGKRIALRGCASARARLQKSTWNRNFAKRLAKPAFGRGRYQIAAQRVLLIQDEATTRDVIEFARALRLMRGESIIPGHYVLAREALRRIAVRAGR